MKRRDFIAGLGVGAVATGLSGCKAEESLTQNNTSNSTQVFNWTMVTTWPPNFPVLGTGAAELAKNIEKMSNGRIKIKIYAAGELVPALEAFDAVSRGTADMAHSGAYYWKGKNPATQFFGALPFGMNAQETNGWMYYGGGLEIWQDIYAPFNIIPFPAGSTGTQMGGWFNKEINSVADLKGLKMRIPGLGGEVLSRAGGTPVNIPGGEIFNALQLGQIDACEWVGPYNDKAFGFHKAAKYYYSPGWHEPNATLEAIFNKESFNALPDDLKSIIELACQAMNMNMLSEYVTKNHQALQDLKSEGEVQFRSFPDEVLAVLKEKSIEVVDELVASNKDVARAYESYKKFQDGVKEWHKISEEQFYSSR